MRPGLGCDAPGGLIKTFEIDPLAMNEIPLVVDSRIYAGANKN